MFCDKLVFLFFFSLLTIVWGDVDSRDVNEAKILIEPGDWSTRGGHSTPGEKKGSNGDEKGGEVNKPDKVDKMDKSDNTDEVDTAGEEEEQQDVDDTASDGDDAEIEDASPEDEEDPPKEFPTEGKNNHRNNIQALINEYYTNVIIPKKSKERAEMEEEKKKMSLMTRVKNFFRRKKEEKKNKPLTLIEYIRQKNKKILELEEERARRHTIKDMYKYLFLTTAYLLFNLAIIPFIGYFYLSKCVRDAIMKQYKNNRDRRIVPYNYDFSADSRSMRFSSKTFRKCRYHLPQTGSDFPFMVGMHHGEPYAIVKL
ncbi:hypothetical protein C922_04492 [Plasmodium inui San Antonio 1]|uniref:Uncharacterized protein n=1 Tax=Plasmodium inui San Antonio 1 TaxID=1237626 RepID=W6ZWE4_9APIC|nr:hypothetical protein C922_04492 [Plasmodium inui San Antonio 1]EUD65092.1 hypothetical protein C922_04492 [Plasmodium inui San Antonio 1]